MYYFLNMTEVNLFWKELVILAPKLSKIFRKKLTR